MVTSKFLKGYAVIKSRWISGNILDEYLPFIATIIVEENMKEIDANIICQKVEEKYDINIQSSVIRLVLSHALEIGLIIKTREQFVANNDKIQKYVISETDFDASWEFLIKSFLKFCKSNGEIEESKETVQKNILEFIEHYDDHVLFNNIEDIDLEDNRFLICWCHFIQFIKGSDPTTYSFVLGLCSANIFKNTLFYSAEKVGTQSDLTLFLDTPMIFALLGMDTKERQCSYRYIVDKAKSVGMEIRVFDHNLEEVRGIIERATRWVLNGQYDSSKANKVAEYLHDSSIDEIDMLELIGQLEDKLNVMGIMVDHSSYLVEENDFQLDENILLEAIKEEYGRRALKYKTEEMYENSILIDVRSLVMIQRKRSGVFSSDLKNCKYLFVTTNGAIAKVSKDIAAGDELSRDKIPGCVTIDLLGTVLWMDFPDNSESYLSLKLIADCKSLLKPSQEMIAHFNLQLDEAYKKGDMTEEQFLFLRSHPIVRDKLLDVTSGDYSSFTDTTWRDVYSRIMAHAQFEGDKKYEEEIEKHNITRQELASATDLLNKKEKDLIEKEKTIIDQQIKFSLIMARIISILVFGIPYLALSLFAIFLQNEYFNKTIKGLAVGAFTVILLLIVGMVYKKIESKIADVILRKIKNS